MKSSSTHTLGGDERPRGCLGRLWIANFWEFDEMLL